jgi:hypothetical protein
MDPVTAAIVSALAAEQVVQAVDHLEAKPTSTSRQGGLQEEIVAVWADQDSEITGNCKVSVNAGATTANRTWQVYHPEQRTSAGADDW